LPCQELISSRLMISLENLANCEFPWSDGHCHIFDESFSATLLDELDFCSAHNITRLLNVALNAEESLMAQHSNDIRLIHASGVHPFYEKSTDSFLSEIEKSVLSGKISFIGEIGLDSRNPDSEWQKKILLTQLEIARDYNLPVIFHIVRKHQEISLLLKKSFPTIKGIIHGFSQSIETCEMFKGLDICFSLGKGITERSSNQSICHIIKKKPYIFETDAPFQKPANLIFIKDQVTDTLSGLSINISEAISNPGINHLYCLLFTIARVQLLSSVNLSELNKSQFTSFSAFLSK